MASRRIRSAFLLPAFALAVCALLAASLPAPADAGEPCKRVALRASKHRVIDGSWVGVKGDACGSRHKVRIRMRKAGHWRVVAKVRSRADGSFSERVRVNANGRRVVRLRATVNQRRSRSVRLHVNPATCPLSRSVPGAPLGMTLGGCRVLASDTASKLDPRSFWGDVDCGTWPNQNLSRHQAVAAGGDLHNTATGAAQGNSAYRSLTAFDGDDYAGERCELGENDHLSGPTAFYHEGQHRATYVSLRLPSNLPIDGSDWQSVLQMKQAQPADGGGGVPILYLGAKENEWRVNSVNGLYGSFPAQPGIWTRFVFDIYYSQDANRGWLQVSADLNADGDFDDPGERSPVTHAATLATETDGPNGSSDGLSAGEPIPSHLRAGLYHNSNISCPPPSGCSAEVDNVQVLAP